ncbi:MAG: copper transport protein [Actinomycetota bacterium]|nr:copper transport protein [Actinomycetota bacterium]
MVKARAGQRTEELVRACLVVSFASASLILLLQTALVSGLSGADLGENSLSSVLSSDFGLWSGARIPLVLGLAVLLVGRVRGVLTKETSTAWWGSWIVLSGGLLVATSLSGHASVAAPPWSVLNDVLHLASGSTWFAGVVGLGVVLPHAVASTGSISLAAAAVSRFATVALVSISLAATTGTINSFLALERFDDLWRDGYGRTLLAKIVVFMVVLGLGGLSHFVIRNRLERAAADAESGRDARRLFQVAIALEVLVGVAILVLTGLLTGLDPPGN